MKSVLTLLLFLFFFTPTLFSQTSSDEITTFILVRHAEKVDDSRDPELSPEGYERAEILGQKFTKITFGAVYSTALTRTMETVREIAEHNDIRIQEYSVQTPEETAAKWIEHHRGDVILVSGHSNTTPTFANALLGEDHFKGPFDESDYDNILIITITGEGDSQLLHLRF